MARAIWKGELVIGKERLPVKLYSAAEDRTIHFHLLDEKHHKPVHQRIVRKAGGKEVERDEQFKALALDRDTAVLLRPEELKKIQPEASRDIEILRFVPRSVLAPQWFEKPYFLGPEKTARDYFGLAAELERQELVGIGRWIMRGKSYVGALTPVAGDLGIVTLRRSEQLVFVSDVEIPASKRPDPREIRMAEQLVEAISGEFDPGEWKDDYHQRVCKMIADKARGKVVHLPQPKAKRASADLSEALKQSLAGLKRGRLQGGGTKHKEKEKRVA